MLNNCEDWVDNEVVRTEVNNNVHDGFYGSTEFNFITVVMFKIKKATDEFCCFGTVSTRIVCRTPISREMFLKQRRYSSQSWKTELLTRSKLSQPNYGFKVTR